LEGGHKIRFWEDAWLVTTLSILFHGLFSIFGLGLTLAEMGEWEDAVWLWRFRWRRTRFQWESTEEEDLIRIISRLKMSKEFKDNLVWGGDVSDDFLVKSTYDSNV